MTTSTKLNPTELLSQLANSNTSGCLEINKEFVSWKIYLQQGKIKYVNCSIQLLEQLKYYLHYLQLEEVARSLKQLPKSLLQNKSSTELYGSVIFWLLQTIV